MDTSIKTISKFLLAAALLPLAGLAGCTHQRAAADAPAAAARPSPSYPECCMEEDYPALLLKAEEVGQARWHFVDPWDTSGGYYCVPCRVLRSHKLEPRPGALVLLAVYSEKEAREARYWFVSGSTDTGHWMPVRVSEDQSVYTASSLDFYGFDAERMLLPVRGKLRGIWREMADMVAEKK